MAGTFSSDRAPSETAPGDAGYPGGPRSWWRPETRVAVLALATALVAAVVVAGFSCRGLWAYHHARARATAQANGTITAVSSDGTIRLRWTDGAGVAHTRSVDVDGPVRSAKRSASHTTRRRPLGSSPRTPGTPPPSRAITSSLRARSSWPSSIRSYGRPGCCGCGQPASQAGPRRRPSGRARHPCSAVVQAPARAPGSASSNLRVRPTAGNENSDGSGSCGTPRSNDSSRGLPSRCPAP